MEKDALIYVAGHAGLVGSALVRALKGHGYDNLITRTKEELDLTQAAAVDAFFGAEKPQYVLIAAARVGGILDNDMHPAEFLYDNVQIATNIIHSAYIHHAKKLLFLGSACVYPRLCPQPIKEEYLLTGPLEPTNSAYAIAKIAGMTMCQAYNRQYGTDFITAMPTNLYGINDTFDVSRGHVLPSLLHKFAQATYSHAPEVMVWGTGTPRREFMYADDVAEALLLLMDVHTGNQTINIGTGGDISIRELALLIQDIVGYSGAVTFDHSKPDGQPLRRMDITRLRDLGFTPATSLREGIEKTYAWYREHVSAQVPATAAVAL